MPGQCKMAAITSYVRTWVLVTVTLINPHSLEYFFTYTFLCRSYSIRSFLEFHVTLNCIYNLVSFVFLQVCDVQRSTNRHPEVFVCRIVSSSGQSHSSVVHPGSTSKAPVAERVNLVQPGMERKQPANVSDISCQYSFIWRISCYRLIIPVDL